MKIDKDLVAAMNRWRADQKQFLQPDDAIIALLTQSLAAQGYLTSHPAAALEQSPDRLAIAFQDFIARTIPSTADRS